jgi:hypothetical protein
MIRFLQFQKTNDILLTENTVREDILRRSIVNAEARKMAKQMGSKSAPKVTKPKEKATVAPASINPHAATIEHINQILDKVSGYENSKITTLCELMLALESGDTKNLITFLKKKDKVVKIKTKY